jgi:hypothetical protein
MIAAARSARNAERAFSPCKAAPLGRDDLSEGNIEKGRGARKDAKTRRKTKRRSDGGENRKGAADLPPFHKPDA